MNLLLSIIVTATCYHAVPEQTNSDCLTTASGKEICCTDSAYSHRYIAVSRDLLNDYPYGTIVTISGCEIEEYNGEWEVQDTMNARWTKKIDFLINPDMPVTNKECIMTK